MYKDLAASMIFTGDGTSTVFPLTFKGAKPSSSELPYLSRSDVKAYFVTFEDNVLTSTEEVSFVWVDDLTIQLSAACPVDKQLRIIRNTGDAYNLTNYLQSVVTEADLELSQRQLLFLAQEASDVSILKGEGSTSLVTNNPVQFQMNGSNLGSPNEISKVNFVGSGIDASVVDGDTIEVAVAAVGGFACFTDAAPQEDGNVYDKVYEGDQLVSFKTSTPDLTLDVLAITGTSSLVPGALVEGSPVTNFARQGDSDVYYGTVDVSLANSSGELHIEHSDGNVITVSYLLAAGPTITTATLTGLYPNAGQTEHAAGQTITLSLQVDQAIDRVEFVSDSGSASIVETQTVSIPANVATYMTITCADRGNTATSYPVKLRVRSSSTGTWSAIVDSANSVTLNNTAPVATIGTITYPASQSALKNTEAATVAVTYAHVDAVLVSSPNGELTITTSPTLVGNVGVTRLSGNYNITTNNLQIVASRTANARTLTYATVVWIAHATPTVSISTPAARLRSGGNAGTAVQNHTITLTADQRVSTPSVTAPAGTFTGSWTTANNGVTYTRTLQVADSDTKGTYTFTGLSVTNLAGIVVTAFTGSAQYVLGGFVSRTVTFGAWPNREANLGVSVSNTAKLSAFNNGDQLAYTFVASVGDAEDTFTISNGSGVYSATGSYVYNRDSVNALGNTSGTLSMIMEEAV